jgi:TATA-box binding protein (TBP) (component of TFIID and TFIIIB)
VRPPAIIVQSIVTSAKLQNNIELETFADLLDNVIYEPELFPGLMDDYDFFYK